MEIDLYNNWEPLNDLPDNFYFYGLNSTGSDLVILLKDSQFDRVLEIKFSGVLGYRVVKEAARSKTLYENTSLVGFETSTNSEFLRWFKVESEGIFDDWQLIHYVICNSDNIIDVISGPPVKAEWVSQRT